MGILSYAWTIHEIVVVGDNLDQYMYDLKNKAGFLQSLNLNPGPT